MHQAVKEPSKVEEAQNEPGGEREATRVLRGVEFYNLWQKC